MKPTGEREVRRYEMCVNEPPALKVCSMVMASDYDSLASAHAAVVAELDKRTGHLLEREKELRSADSELKRAWYERDALTARCSELERGASEERAHYLRENAALRAKLQAAERVVEAARFYEDEHRGSNSGERCPCPLCTSLAALAQSAKGAG